MILLVGAVSAAPFTSTWDTTKTSSGSSDANQIKLPLESDGDYDFTVNWGDGDIDHITAWDQAEVTHTYASSGVYDISISGTIIGFRFINGNEIGVLLLQSILSVRKGDGTLPRLPIFINTLVTSSLQREIARRYGCQVVGDLMVGFKYMGDVLRNLEQHGKFPKEGASGDRDGAVGTTDDFVFTCEESHGFLLTPRVRDKDACGAAVHLAGLASDLKDQGKTILGMLRDIYRVYGYTSNRLRSLVMEGIVGLERIGQIQKRLRENPPEGRIAR